MRKGWMLTSEHPCGMNLCLAPTLWNFVKSARISWGDEINYGVTHSVLSIQM